MMEPEIIQRFLESEGAEADDDAAQRPVVHVDRAADEFVTLADLETARATFAQVLA